MDIDLGDYTGMVLYMVIGCRGLGYGARASNGCIDLGGPAGWEMSSRKIFPFRDMPHWLSCVGREEQGGAS